MSFSKLLCAGQWSDASSWEFFLSDELPAAEICTAASCVGILEPSGQIVLSHTFRGWGCMGGHIEPGETVVEAMRREALEEGGMHVERYMLLGYRKVTNSSPVISKQTGKPYPAVSYVPWFVALTSQPLVATAGDEGEVFESAVFSVAEARTLQPAEWPLIEAGLALYNANRGDFTAPEFRAL